MAAYVPTHFQPLFYSYCYILGFFYTNKLKHKMEFIIKNTSNSYPKTYYKLTFFSLNFINTYQLWSINLVVLNILFKVLKEKVELKKSFYCKNETFVKNYYGEYCKKQCKECKLKSK